MLQKVRKNKNAFLGFLSCFFIFKPSSYSQKNLKIFKGFLNGFSKGVKGLVFGVFFIVFVKKTPFLNFKVMRLLLRIHKEGAGSTCSHAPFLKPTPTHCTLFEEIAVFYCPPLPKKQRFFGVKEGLGVDKPLFMKKILKTPL